MTETTSRVYDLIYPSPVTLKEISAISLVAELWREEIARNGIETSTELDSAKEDVLLKKIIPYVPSAIYDLLVEYIAKSRSSITPWLPYARCFHDFVWDWDGFIHNDRTAKRMMLCDQLTADEKFRIACKYCLEDDIRRLWPFVSSDIHSIEIHYDDNSLLYYWICCLRNELHNLPNSYDLSIDEMMLYECERESFSSIAYFWNRIPYESRLQATIFVSESDYHCGLFARFILPKLDDVQLETFLDEQGVDFMCSLLIDNIHVDKITVLPAWMYIRNKMSRSQFIQLIERLLVEETNVFTEDSKDEVYACCEVWENSPDNFKQWALNAVLSNEELFIRMSIGPNDPRQMRFLITVLLDASFEQRHKFWCENWRNLIFGAPVEDLLEVMKLCFRYENDISSFKEQYMSKYENIGPYCVKALKDGCFEELSKFLYFCYSDKQNVKQLKQQLLRSNFLGGDSILSFDVFCSYHEELNSFVEDAFDDVDLRAEFRNQFVSSTVTEEHLSKCILVGDFHYLTQFVETFVPEEPAVRVLKQRFFDDFNERLVSGVIWMMEGDNLQKFLAWLFDSEDEIDEFKQSLAVGDIFCKMVQIEIERADLEWGDSLEYPDRLDYFLNWYFNNNAEKIRKFKERYSDELQVFVH
ncbi:uncharacterized protein LOC135838639 [Planococcus citri]|uniref:uncharacterized protein LOC135838639 n=1 Tax=Planococcus citri TaxID=170843 RepID=UPI0031F7D4F0